jgi:hypothetical protein
MTALTLNSLSRSLGLSPRRGAARSAAPAIVAAGLIAEWRFDQGAGQTLTDYSGNGHHGRLGSTAGSDADDPTWGSSPARLIFDGGDGVTIPAFASPTTQSYLAIAKFLSATQDFGMLCANQPTAGSADTTASLQIFRNAAPAQTNTYRTSVSSGGTQSVSGTLHCWDGGWHLLEFYLGLGTGSGNRTYAAFIDQALDVSGAGWADPLVHTDTSQIGCRFLGTFACKAEVAWIGWWSKELDANERTQMRAYAHALAAARGITLP